MKKTGRSYAMERGEWQEEFCRFLEECGFDGYGYREGEDPPYENDTFVIRPYYWGEDEDEADKPNFVYKPGGIKIWWYKYPLRAAECSHNISFREFRKILRKCSKSLNAEDRE